MTRKTNVAATPEISFEIRVDRMTKRTATSPSAAPRDNVR